MYRRWLGALQFLTVLPVRGRTSSPAEAAVFFPLTGALLGVAAGAAATYGSRAFGRSLGALLALALLAGITGGLHEDGLADVADAIRAGRSRDRMLEILKDSRIGAYGAIALILSFLLRWQAIAAMSTPVIAGLTVALALSRASMVIAAGCVPVVGSGLAHSFAAGCGRGVVLATVFQGIVIVALFGFYGGWVRAGVLAAACTIVILSARTWFLRRLGGMNGDCLGATCQAVEITALMVLAWRLSF